MALQGGAWKWSEEDHALTPLVCGMQGSTASEWREAASAAALLGSNGEALNEAMKEVACPVM